MKKQEKEKEEVVVVEEKKIFEITVERFFRHREYTMGRMIIDNKVFCNTLEDTERFLYQGMDLEIIRKRKVYGKTAVPKGRYKINMERLSPKFSKMKFYQDVCKGLLPEIEDVPGFDAVLIHVGATEENTAGCLLVGMNTEKGMLTDGKNTFKKLYKILKKHYDNGEELWITIK